MREYSARRREQGDPLHLRRKTVDAVCESCGKDFSPFLHQIASGQGRYCTLECFNAKQSRGSLKEKVRARHFEQGAPGSARRRAFLRAAKAAAGTSGGNLVWVQGACIVCGDEYTSPGSQSRYCSRECRAKNRSARSFGLSWLDRMALFARDGWVCQICSEPVDYSADPQSDWYPTLDHIVPRSHGGSDDESNLRTAHRWCNSVRGDLSYYTDEDLAVA